MNIGNLPTEETRLLRRLREDLHRHPELAYQERRTAGVVAEELRRLSCDVTEGVAGTGVVGLLRGGRVGRCVALRADMDALPIREETGLAYASETEGVMHACGHDGHVVVVLGVARALAARRGEWSGTVKLVFQPAEEEGAGARAMVAAGTLRDPPVDAIFALHARPEIGAGSVELEEVPNAACDAFDVRVIGRGCHGAYPHRGVDPVLVASQMVCSLQQVVSRQVPPDREAVVTVGSLHGGTRRNIIPGEAQLQGTIRTRDPEVRNTILASVRRIVEGVAAAAGAKAELSFGESTPRLRNHPAMLGLVRRVAVATLGPAQVVEGKARSMGGEDFAFFLLEQGGVPGCMFRLGVECAAPLHSPNFDFGDQALEPGVRVLSNVALEFLGSEGGV